jgi:hypothetical protein
MRSSLVLCVLVATGCQKNTVTPEGSEVLSWDRSQSSRREIVAATELGAREIKDVKIVATPFPKKPVELAIHLETARLEFDADGARIQHTSPVTLKVKVGDNESWTVTGACLGGPNFQFGSVGPAGMETPAAMALQCRIVLKYLSTTKDFTDSIFLEVYGDGRISHDVSNGTIRVLP